MTLPFSGLILPKPLFLGIVTLLSGGVATASIIKLELSHSPIKDNVSKLGTSISKLLEFSSAKGNSVSLDDSRVREPVSEVNNTIPSSTLGTKLQSGVQTVKQGYEDIKSGTTTGTISTTEGKSSVVSSLKDLYEKLKSSETKDDKKEKETEKNRIKIWVNAIKEGYNTQANTTKESS